VIYYILLEMNVAFNSDVIIVTSDAVVVTRDAVVLV